MDRNYKLYVHISPSGKKYYGITKQKVEYRWNNGKGYKPKKNKDGELKGNIYFWNSICKYGWDNFEHIVLFDNITEEEAKLMEKMYIALYDTTNEDKGYNGTFGGEGVSGYKHSEESKKKISESQKGENNHKSTKIYCVELDRYFDTVIEASKIIGCCRQSISKVLNGKYKTAKGYHWIYAEDVNEENINKVMCLKGEKTKTKIYCVELNRYFNSITECAEIIGCSYKNISSVLHGRSKTAKGYHFIFASEVENNNSLVS